MKKESDDSPLLILLTSARNLFLIENMMPKAILMTLIDLKEIELHLYNHGFNIKNGKSELTLKPYTANGIVRIKQSASSLGLSI